MCERPIYGHAVRATNPVPTKPDGPQVGGREELPMRKMLIALAGGALVVALATPAGASVAVPQRGGSGHAPGVHGGNRGNWGPGGDHWGRGDRGDRGGNGDEGHGRGDGDNRDGDHRDGDHRDGDHRGDGFRGGYPGYDNCDRGGYFYGPARSDSDNCDSYSYEQNDCCNY